MGEWEDHTWHELNVKYPEEMYNFNRRADLWRVPGAETAQQVVDRFIPALERVARAHEGGTAAVFSHGMALRTVLGVLQGQTLAEVGQTPHGDNTAVSLLEWENGTFRVVYRDDNSHLTERGLSTFARQSWWKEKNMVESGEGYGPLPEEKRAALGMPAGGEATGVWYGEALIGAFSLSDEGDALRLSWYGLTPQWRGKGLGIPPMGQAVDACLRRGRSCGWTARTRGCGCSSRGWALCPRRGIPWRKMCGVLCRRYRRRGSNGGGFCVNTSRRGEGFAAPWREQLSFIVERKLPKKAA